MRAGSLALLLLLSSGCDLFSFNDPAWVYTTRDATLLTPTGQHISAHFSATALTGSLFAHVTLTNSEADTAALPNLQFRATDKRGAALRQPYREHSGCVALEGSIKLAPGLSCTVEAPFEIRPRVGLVFTRPNPDLQTVRLVLLDRQVPTSVLVDIVLTH
jgi:hypothetical protein